MEVTRKTWDRFHGGGWGTSVPAKLSSKKIETIKKPLKTWGKPIRSGRGAGPENWVWKRKKGKGLGGQGKPSTVTGVLRGRKHMWGVLGLFSPQR